MARVEVTLRPPTKACLQNIWIELSGLLSTFTLNPHPGPASVKKRPVTSASVKGSVKCCAEWRQAQRSSVNRPAGTWEIKTETKEDGSLKGVTGES